MMTLFKTTLWTGLSTFIKIISTYVLWKVIAVYTGPTGIAIMEQFQNFIQICRSFCCSLNQGIIKYISEYKNDEVNKSKIISSALVAYCCMAIFVSFVLFLFSPYISSKVFSSFEYTSTIKLLAVSIILFALNNLFLSVLNGEFEIQKYVTSNIINTFFIFFLTVYLVINYGIQGGLIGFVFNQSITLFLTGFLVTKSKWFKLNSYFQGLDTVSIRKLAKYAVISFVPILIVPISLIISRRYIANQLSWQDAGYWQGIMKLSDGYLILMELMINVYFLPKLSGITTLKEFKSEVFSCYRLIFPLAIIGAIFLFFFKKPIVTLLYSAEFLPMLILFKYQLIGDVTRIGTWLLTNVMAARAIIIPLLSVEIASNITYILITMVFVHHFGLIGTAMAFALNSIIYFIIMIYCTQYCIRTGAFKLT